MTTAEILAAIAVHRAAIRVLEAQLTTAPASAAPAPATARKQPTASRPRYQSAQAAFRRFPFIQEHTVRRLCSDHPEWARRFTSGGAWLVDADRFDAFADLVEAGQASFGMSAKFAVSVAQDEQLALDYDPANSIRESEDVK